MLFAEGRSTALALACTVPWRNASTGFVGYSDGWQMLFRPEARPDLDPGAKRQRRRRGKHRPNAAKCHRRQLHMARNGGNRIRKKRKGSGFYASFNAPA